MIFALSPWPFLLPLVIYPATPLLCPVLWQLAFGDHHMNTVPSHPGFCVMSLPFSPIVRVVKQDAVSRWSTVCVLFLIPCFPCGAATFHETVSWVLLCFSLNNRKNGFCVCITWAYLEWTEGSEKVVQKGEGRGGCWGRRQNTKSAAAADGWQQVSAAWASCSHTLVWVQSWFSFRACNPLTQHKIVYAGFWKPLEFPIFWKFLKVIWYILLYNYVSESPFLFWRIPQCCCS